MSPAPGPPLRPLPGWIGRTGPGDPALDGLGMGGSAVDDRRARILAAAAEAIAADGYHAATLESIVRGARVGWKAFYRQFDDKQAVFLALLDEAYAAALAGMGAAAAAAPEPWPRSVAAALRALLAAIAAAPDRARGCLVEALTAGPAAVARYERALREAGALLRPGRRLGDGAAELAPTLEETLAGGVAWMAYQRLVAGEAERVPELLPEALDFVLRPYLGEHRTAAAVSRWARETSPPNR